MLHAQKNQIDWKKKKFKQLPKVSVLCERYIWNKWILCLDLGLIPKISYQVYADIPRYKKDLNSVILTAPSASSKESSTCSYVQIKIQVNPWQYACNLIGCLWNFPDLFSLFCETRPSLVLEAILHFTFGFTLVVLFPLFFHVWIPCKSAIKSWRPMGGQRLCVFRPWCFMAAGMGHKTWNTGLFTLREECVGA